MKKMLSLMIVVLMIISSAFAEGVVSSPSLKQPIIQIVVKPSATQDPSATAAPGTTVAPEETTVNLVIREVELDKMPESTAKLFQQLQMQLVVPTAVPSASPAADATLEPGASASPEASITPEATAAPTPAPVKVDITTIVPEDTVKQIVDKLPETSKIENLAVTEFIPMTVANYDTEIGDVQAQVVTTVKYQKEEVVTPLLGVWNGTEMVWFVPDMLIAEDGSLILNFTAEMLAMMQDCEPVLMILSDLEVREQVAAQALAAAAETISPAETSAPIEAAVQAEPIAAEEAEGEAK